MTRLNDLILYVAIMVVLFLIATSIYNVATAKGQDDTAINLARCMMAETDTYSGRNNVEWSAMSWVLRKRAEREGVTLNEMTLAYCAVFDKRSANYGRPRTSRIRRSTFQEPLYGTQAEWAKVEGFVDDFLRDEHKDPCPAAEHFGCESDVPGVSAYHEVCKWLGRKGNKFYKVKR